MQKIKYFQSVVKNQSFTKAAEENFISQSAISQQIQVLENDLGVKLLHRGRKKFSLTPAGEFFYKKTLVLINDFDRICLETLKIAKGDNQKISVGYLRHYNGNEIKETVAEFNQKFPEIFIEILPGTHEELYYYLRTGKIDLAISDLRRKPSDQYVNFFLADKFCYAELPENSTLAQLEKITVDELKNMPLILIAPHDQEIEEENFFREYFGVKSEFIFAENFEQVHLIISANRGYSWAEFQKTPTNSDKIKFVPIFQNDNQLFRKYYAFGKVERFGKIFDDFAQILKSKFQ